MAVVVLDVDEQDANKLTTPGDGVGVGSLDRRANDLGTEPVGFRNLDRHAATW
jgi:hypothetical protein